MSTDAVIIWGELLWDCYPAPAIAGDGDPGGAAGEAVPRGVRRLGGAPANVAWHLAQAGGRAQLVTRVGDDADGRRALALLDDLVDTSLIQIDPDRATGRVTIELDRGEPRFTLHPGRAWERIACTEAAREAIREAQIFVYGTLSQRMPEGFAQWQLAIEAARARALKVYDANLRPNDQATHVIGRALAQADLIKLNDREVAQLRDLFGWADPIDELRAPAGARPRIVAVTHGAAGSTIHPIDGGAIEIAGVRADPGGDNVGCGDAYLALLLFGMTSGWDLLTSGRVASRWAAAVASVRGATPRFDEHRIAELLEAA